jgi:predicted DNA-binding protein YlxM (UPF0122 family)
MKTPDKEALERLYWAEQKPLKDIAAQFNVTIPAIRQKMDKLGIPRRSNSDAQKLASIASALTDEMLRQLYLVDQLSQSQIADRYQISQGTVGNLLRAAGIQARNKANIGTKNGMHGRTHTPEARAKIRAANLRQFSSAEARQRHAELTADQIAAGPHWQNGQPT